MIVDSIHTQAQELDYETALYFDTGREHRLHKALSFVASACDGARRLDGTGFNKFDTQRGKQLVEMRAEQWKEKDIRDAEHLVVKYRKQIELLGTLDEQLQGRT